MRLEFATPTLILLLALAGCGLSSGGPDNDKNFAPNCAEQADLARNGRSDGRSITITCP